LIHIDENLLENTVPGSSEMPGLRVFWLSQVVAYGRRVI
jgi:hypothetical protein